MIKSKICNGNIIQIQYKQYHHYIKKYEINFDTAPIFSLE